MSINRLSEIQLRLLSLVASVLIAFCSVKAQQANTQSLKVVCHQALVRDSAILVKLISTSFDEYCQVKRQVHSKVKHAVFHRIFSYRGEIVVESYERLPVEDYQFAVQNNHTTRLNFFAYCFINGTLVFFPDQDLHSLGVAFDISSLDTINVDRFNVENFAHSASSSRFSMDGTPVNKGKRLKLIR